MDFSIKSGELNKLVKGCVVLPFNNDLKLSPTASKINRQLKNKIKTILKDTAFSGEAGDAIFLQENFTDKCTGVILVGLGDKSSSVRGNFFKMASAIFDTLKKFGLSEATIVVDDFSGSNFGLDWIIKTTSRVLTENSYTYSHTKKTTSKEFSVKRLTVISSQMDKGEIKDALARGSAIGEGCKLAKDLGNLPPNICTPSFLASKSKSLGRQKNVSVSVLGRKEMEKLGMGSLLSVSNGSYEPPQLVIIKYSGGRKSQRPVVLVGKGITFDTGGISLKPSSGMDEMKYDMSGAGSVIGTMQAVAKMELPMNVIALIPASENMPGGGATKPSDIVTSMSGKTIEILNTDAEGRLVLCDALTYASRFNPSAVIDVATLTGACVVALGHVATGLFSNNEVLADDIEQAGHESWDRVWRLPTWPEYHEQLESNFADMANIGGRGAGSVTAACFLEKFATFPWAHLDIAGTAWNSGKSKGSTGRPVPLLCEYLMKKSGW